MTNPTPTTREREAAREQEAETLLASLECLIVRHEMDYKADIDRIVAALAQARKEGKRDALTEAAQVALDNKPKDWSELDTTSERITAAVEAMREKP